MIGVGVLSTNNNTVVPGEKVYSELPGSGNNIQQETQKDFLDFENKNQNNKNQNNNVSTVSNNKYVENIPFEKSGIEAKTFTTIPTPTQQSSSSVGGSLPTGGLGQGGQSWLNKNSGRILKLPKEDDPISPLLETTQQQQTQPNPNLQQNNNNYEKYDELNGASWLNKNSGNPQVTNPTQQQQVVDQGAFNQEEFDKQTVTELENARKKGLWDGGLSIIEEGGEAGLKKIMDDEELKNEKINSDMQFQQDEFDRQAEQTNAEFMQAQEEITRKGEQDIANAEFMGAWTGAGQSSGYVKGIQNMTQDVQRTLTNLTQAFQRANTSNKAQAKKSLDDFQRILKQEKSNFDYTYRNITQSANINWNEQMERAQEAGFSKEAIENAMGSLATKVIKEREEAKNAWLDGIKKQTDIINSQIEGATRLQNLEDIETAKLTTILDANGGQALRQVSAKQLDDMVASGQLSPSQATAYKLAAMEMSAQTLQQYGRTTTWDGKIVQQGVVTAADMNQIKAYVDQGFTYGEAVAQVASNNPNRFNKVPIQQPLTQSEILSNRQKELEIQKTQNELNGSATGGGATGDLRYLASQYPWQARAKNNNPWGITWWAASQGLKDARDSAWISYWKGTSRPWNEWWSYVEFPTIEDWLEAQWIALSRGWGDINQRLQARVWTSEGSNYAQTVMGWAWIPKGKKFTDLSDQEAQALQMAVIRKESPWLYKLLNSSSPTWPNSDLNALADYLIDTQPRGAGYSDDDVKAYSDAIRKYASRGDKETVYQLYRNQVLKDKNNATVYDNATDIQSGINNLQSLIKQYENSGGKMNIFNGTIQKVIQKTWSAGNPLLLQISQQLGMLTADYIRQISGTAAADKEVERLTALMPSLNSTFDRAIILSDWFKKRVGKTAQNAIENTMGKNKGMFKEIFGELEGTSWPVNPNPNTPANNTPANNTQVTPANPNRKVKVSSAR